jgi:hypothetical protein
VELLVSVKMYCVNTVLVKKKNLMTFMDNSNYVLIV